MVARSFVLLALMSGFALAARQGRVPDCRTSSTEKLSPGRLKSMVLKTEPITILDRVHIIDDVVVIAIAVDALGKVTCLQVISGPPIIVGSTIDSVKMWRFQPYTLRGRSRAFCGRLALLIKADENGVKYDVVEAPAN